MLHPNNLRSIGWASIIVAAMVGFGVLTLKVNSVKSEVRQQERRIIALQNEKMMLETEFETRSRQQQLSQWNDVDFGYQAPRAEQFVEGERQLAMLGVPRSPGAPAPIRVAVADTGEPGRKFPHMVSPLTGKTFAADVAEVGDRIPASVVRLVPATAGLAR